MSTTPQVSETKSIPHIVERIYLTRGNPARDIDGASMFKNTGVVINGQIHWLDYYCSNILELGWIFRRLGIQVNQNTWFYKDDDDDAPSHRITKIGLAHKVFAEDSSYWKRTKLPPSGEARWSIEELEATYYNLATT